MTAVTRWMFYDPLLSWLFPATYALHLLEEWTVRAPIALWWTRLDPPLDIISFGAPNVFAMTLMIVGVRLASIRRNFHWIVPALATAVLLNTAGHIVGSVVVREYSAGLATGVIFWVPLGMLTLMRVASQSTRKTLIGGVAVGVAIEAMVVTTLALVS